MKHKPIYTAACIWARGHVAFFIAGLFIMGPGAVMTSFIALLLSLPALVIYMPLCLMAGRVKPFPLRFFIVLAAAVIITHFSFIIGSEGDETLGGMEDSFLYYAAIGSTALSVVSAGYMLQDARAAATSEDAQTTIS